MNRTQFCHLISRNATQQKGTMINTIQKTFDYIDGGFVKKDSLLLCDSKPLCDVPLYAQKFIRESDSNNNFYTHVDGEQVLLDVLSLRAKSSDLYYQNTDNILITAGAVNAFSALCHTLCDEGDVILTLSPSYILLANCVKAYGAELVLVPAVLQNGKFQVTADALKSTIESVKQQNRKIKGLLIVNPTNVDGQFWSEDEIDAIAPVIIDHELLVIEDRVYDGLCFDTTSGEPAFFANHPKLSQQCITIDSVSKRYGATQWRIGWAFGPVEIIKIAKDYVMNSVWSANSLYQKASAHIMAAEMSEQQYEQLPHENPSRAFIDNARLYHKEHNLYMEHLLSGYRERRDLCLLLFNGTKAYKAEFEALPGMTPCNVLLDKYGSHIEDYGITQDGIAGFNTPMIPKTSMFISVQADEQVFKGFPSKWQDKSQMLNRLIYLNSKVVLLPPTEVTLPEDCYYYRMEYGVALDLLFNALSKLQQFMTAWCSSDLETQWKMVVQANNSLPEQYRQSTFLFEAPLDEKQALAA